MEKRHYTFQGADFLLEPISDSVVRVTHVDQVGYVGMSTDWNPHKLDVWTMNRRVSLVFPDSAYAKHSRSSGPRDDYPCRTCAKPDVLSASAAA